MGTETRNGNFWLRYLTSRKSVSTAFILWSILGTLGGHRFYLGDRLLGGAYLALVVLGGALTYTNFGGILFLAVYVWLVVDAILLSKTVNGRNIKFQNRLLKNLPELPPQEKLLLNYENQKKSLGAAYILWSRLGFFGGHRFYLGRKISAGFMLAFGIVILLLFIVGIAVAVATAFINYPDLIDRLRESMYSVSKIQDAIQDANIMWDKFTGAFIVLGLAVAGALGMLVWLLIDAVLIYGMVKTNNGVLLLKLHDQSQNG